MYMFILNIEQPYSNVLYKIKKKKKKEKEKNIINLLSAEFAQRVVKLK